MRDPRFFRRKLAHRLRNGAERRRLACFGHPSGEDLKVLSLLERLACDAAALPASLIGHLEDLRADAAFSRRFDEVWDRLDDGLGILVVPASAAELVGWMIDQAACRDGVGATPPRLVAAPRPRRPKPAGVLTAVAHDFTGSLAVVGPMLAVWEVGVAIGQWRDRQFAATHPATIARVTAVAAGPARGGAPATETLAFTPQGVTSACRIEYPLGTRRPDTLGQTVMVVPRASSCAMPVLPDGIGDPTLSLGVAVAFLIAGIASYEAWSGLRGRVLRLRRSKRHRPSMPGPVGVGR